MWARLGGSDHLLADPPWARNLLPQVDEQQIADHQQVLDLLDEAVATGRMTEAERGVVVEKFRKHEP
ncbi:hypothetical protein Cch02nite_65280 [Catellatospora chokoriensis]|uniref:Uncharacterized protein n=1 Tax=Catellatospora chokoriensis TaxID=310353 RepID=A0A8J3KDL8_9ACTN|nr:hypothetical protein Cch02nite_65280 [Catellatospora chokoriensis]